MLIPFKEMIPNFDSLRNTRREKFLCLGGSDIGTVMGMKPWGLTPMNVFDSKMSLEDTPDSEAMYWGNSLEKAVMDRFDQDNPSFTIAYGLDQATEYLFNENYPYMVATPDFIVKHEDGSFSLGEIKTTSQESWKEAPLYYQAQMLWNITVCESIFDVQFNGAYMPSLHNTNRYQCRFYSRDELSQNVNEELMVDMGKSFIEKHLLTGIAPDASSYEESIKALGESDDVLEAELDTFERFKKNLTKKKFIDKQIKDLEAERDSIKFLLSEEAGPFKKVFDLCAGAKCLVRGNISSSNQASLRIKFSQNEMKGRCEQPGMSSRVRVICYALRMA